MLPRSVELQACLARHELDCRGPRDRAHYVIDVLCWVVTILRAVLGVDLVVEAELSVYKGHIYFDTACPDATFVANLRAAEPHRRSAIHGSDVDIVADADDPDRSRLRIVSSCRSDVIFFSSSTVPILWSSSLIHV